MANDDEDGTDYDMDFRKNLKMSLFIGLSLAQKSLKFCKKSCCSVDFLQEIAFSSSV